MRVVRTPNDEEAVALATDGDQWPLRFVSDGTEVRVQASAVRPVPEADVLDRLGSSLSRDAPPLPVDDQRVAGLLVAIAVADPLPVRRMMTLTEACESTVVPWTSALRQAGLVERVDHGGTPGYRPTEQGRAIAGSLRER